MKTNKYTGTRSLILRYKKDSWNREITEYVNSFFASIFTVEEVHEIANLKFPSLGQIPEKLFTLKHQQNILGLNQQKEWQQTAKSQC